MRWLLVAVILLLTNELVHASTIDEVSTMLSMGAVGVWPFNEASGTTIFDASSNGQNGTYQTSGVSLGVASIVNDSSSNYRTAASLSTSTSSAYLGSIPNSSTIALANFTAVLWFQFNSTNSQLFAIPYGMDVEVSPTSGWEAVQNNGTTNPYVRIDTPTGANQTNTTSLVAFDGSVHMLATGVVNNGGFISVDAGTYVTFSITGTLGISLGPLLFGNSAALSADPENCNGTYQDAAMFSGQLTQQQLTTLYNCGTGAGGCVSFTPPAPTFPSGPAPISINPPPRKAQRLRGARL